MCNDLNTNLITSPEHCQIFLIMYYIKDNKIMENTIIQTTEFKNRPYCLVTDSGCDLPLSYLESEGIKCVPLGFYFENEEILMDSTDMSAEEFYKRIRNGEVAKTSAPSPERFEKEFRTILESGRDILYLGLDSAISTTVNSGRIAAEELREEYADRKIFVLDTLCASAGLGLLVAMTKAKMDAGISLSEALEYAKDLAPKISHRFTVETLTYLCRGGRVNKGAAAAGNLLNIKPVLHADDKGYLVNLAKARGRAKSLSMLVDAYAETASCYATNTGNAGVHNTPAALGENNSMIMISHADCKEDAEDVAKIIKERFNRDVNIITDIGPVIGAHSGPGTVALFFVATRR